MRKHMHKFICSCLLSPLLLLLSAGMSMAEPIGRVISLSGEVFAENGGKTRQLSLKADVEREDTIRTNATGKVQIFFEDDTTVTVGPNARLQMQEFVAEGSQPAFKAHLVEGMARVITGKIVEKNPLGFQVTTPEATVGIRGTVLAIRSREGNTSVFVESTLKTVYVNDVLVPKGFKASSNNLTPSAITPADLKAIEAEVGGATPKEKTSASDSDSGSGDSSSSGDSGGGSGGAAASASSGAASAASGNSAMTSAASAGSAGGAGPSSSLAMASSPSGANSSTFAAMSAKVRYNGNNNNSVDPTPPGPTPPGPTPPPPTPVPRPPNGNVTGTLTAGPGGFIAEGTTGTFGFNFNLTTGVASGATMSMDDGTNSFTLAGGRGGHYVATDSLNLNQFNIGSAVINGTTYNAAPFQSTMTANNNTWTGFTQGNAIYGVYNAVFGPSGPYKTSSGTFESDINTGTP